MTDGSVAGHVIGKPVVRKEDERLVTGRGRFSDDFSLAARPMPRWCALRIRTPASSAWTPRRAKAMPGVLGVSHRRGLPGRRAWPDPARSAAQDQVRHEARRSRRRSALHRPPPAVADRQGAPCRRSGGDGGGRHGAQALDAAEAVEVHYEVLPGVYPLGGCHEAAAPRYCGTRCQTTPGRYVVRRSRTRPTRLSPPPITSWP